MSYTRRLKELRVVARLLTLIGTMTERRLGVWGLVMTRKCGVADCFAMARNCKNCTRVVNLLDLGII